MRSRQAITRFYAILAATVVLVSGARADGVQAPSWQTLEYEYETFWASARSTLELSRCVAGEDKEGWCLDVRSSLANNYEQVSITATRDGTLLHRSRLSGGKNQRLKEWDYGPSSILRERREPGPQSAATPAEWPVTSQRELAYPAGNHQITDASLLLALAAPGKDDSGADRHFTVQTDLNFYRVSAAPDGSETVSVNYRTNNGVVAQAASRRVTLVAMQAEPLEPLLDKPDFSLLGLTPPLTIAYDTESGLPVQLRGTAPRLGAVALNLTSAVIRDNLP